MVKHPFPLDGVYALLEPGPVVLLSTAHKGRSNVMTLSWQTPMEFNPPLVGCVVSSGDFSFKALKATRLAVINIPTRELAEKVVACGNCTGEARDKFKDFGLTPVPQGEGEPPLVAECHASLACKVVDTRLVNRYGFFVLEVTQAWVDTSVKNPRTLHHRGFGAFMVAGETIQLDSKMP
jgi:flavin reductase (DIM6/NTAB) family NADH-FMN oxidoreductase RutF